MTTGPRMRVLLVPSCEISQQDILTKENSLFRCRKGLELWNTGDYDLLLVTGGIFYPPQIQTIPAATLMARWFVEQGVSPSVIISEDRSLDTYQNISFGIEVLRKRDLWPCSLTVVTQWQHGLHFFITCLLQHRFLIRVKPLHQPISWITWVKEWFLLLYHLYDHAGTKYLARKNRADRTPTPYS